MNVGSLLTALAAIPGILIWVDRFASAVALWWVQRQNNETLSKIADAAAFAARAQSEEDRYAAAVAWQSALSRPRASPEL